MVHMVKTKLHKSEVGGNNSHYKRKKVYKCNRMHLTSKHTSGCIQAL
jgi:hypothetical protein